MNEEELENQIAKILSEAIEQISRLSCKDSESHCKKDDPDYQPKLIHCGTDRYKGLHKMV